jgi:uncharacterized repeat protein (TIGR03803 family)
LVMDSAGNLYGVASGTLTGSPGGNIYELEKQNGGWRYNVLYRFCRGNQCPRGDAPQGDLIMDTQGNLYGTAYGGGKHNAGTVFELAHEEGRWHIKVLHQFCGLSCAQPDGEDITAGLAYEGLASGEPYDGASPLYGVASDGGAFNGGGVFRLMPVTGSARWKEALIYNFCTADDCSNGANPTGMLTLDGAGNLYGTTATGGGHEGGIAFELSNTKRNTWSETVLYNFCCADGQNSNAPLLQDSGGILYGTTPDGGQYGWGTVFKLTDSGSQWSESVVHSFCSPGNCGEGAEPQAGLLLDSQGNLIGTQEFGGGADLGYGAVTKLSPAGVVLDQYSFCSKSGCADGANPVSRLVADGNGNLYGTTQFGGAANEGTVFELSP